MPFRNCECRVAEEASASSRTAKRESTLAPLLPGGEGETAQGLPPNLHLRTSGSPGRESLGEKDLRRASRVCKPSKKWLSIQRRCSQGPEMAGQKEPEKRVPPKSPFLGRSTCLDVTAQHLRDRERPRVPLRRVSPSIDQLPRLIEGALRAALGVIREQRRKNRTDHPAGAITEFSLSNTSSTPNSIVSGPDATSGF